MFPTKCQCCLSPEIIKNVLFSVPYALNVPEHMARCPHTVCGWHLSANSDKRTVLFSGKKNVILKKKSQLHYQDTSRHLCHSRCHGQLKFYLNLWVKSRLFSPSQPLVAWEIISDPISQWLRPNVLLQSNSCGANPLPLIPTFLSLYFFISILPKTFLKGKCVKCTKAVEIIVCHSV